MKFSQYLLTEEDHGSSHLVESLTGTLRVGKHIKMTSKNGKTFTLYGMGEHPTEGPIIIVKIDIFNEDRLQSQLARLSYHVDDDMGGTTYYAYINTDDSKEMDSTLNDLFE